VKTKCSDREDQGGFDKTRSTAWIGIRLSLSRPHVDITEDELGLNSNSDATAMELVLREKNLRMPFTAREGNAPIAHRSVAVAARNAVFASTQNRSAVVAADGTDYRVFIRQGGRRP
jgi:hypothetical protein